MPCLHVLSGPCGCGKSTLADAWAARRVRSGTRHQVYVIHGDDFHRGFVETERCVGPDCPGFQYWPDILRFNWECMLFTAGRALARGLDVIIDYVVEDELPQLRALAKEYGVPLRYAVLTVSQEELEQRLKHRGDPQLIERSLFLKRKLENEPQHREHLLDVSGMTVEEAASALEQRWQEHPAS